MLAFKPITIQAKSELEPYLDRANSYFCDYCFADIYMWKDFFETMYCIEDNTLFLIFKSTSDQTLTYAMPVGYKYIECAISLIREDAKERNIPICISCITEEQMEELKSVYPNDFAFEQLRDFSDYIYRSADLIDLTGNKFHKKKNLINRFKKDHKNNWIYEDITAENIHEIWAFYESWFLDNNERESPFLIGERQAIRLALDHFGALNLHGGLIRLNSQVIAFSLGTKSTEDVFVIQIEKANPNIIGSYQMINQQFALANCQNSMWINREEDLGIMGLRKAKLSYHPAFLSMKYLAKLRKNGDD